MNTLRIKVTGNTAELIDGLMPASGDRNFSEFKFLFNDEWNKVATVTVSMFFSKDNIVNRLVAIENGICTVSIPQELTQYNGTLYVGLVGSYSSDDEIKRISTHLLPIKVGQGSIITDEANTDLYLSVIDALANTAELKDFNDLNTEVLNARDGERDLSTKINKMISDYKNADNKLYNMVYPPSPNIFKLDDYSISADANNGVAISIDNGLITAKGTATADIRLIIPVPSTVMSAGTYTYAVKNLINNQTKGITVYIKDTNYANISNVYCVQNESYNKKTFTIAENKTVGYISISVGANTIIDETFNLQLEVGEKSTDYVSPDERYFGGDLTKQVETLRLDTVTADVFGAVGDGVTDDTEALQKAIDYCSDKYKILKLVSGKTYLISKVLQFTGKSIYLDGSFATIKADKRLPTIDVTLSDGTSKAINPMIYVDCLNINDNYNNATYEEQNYRMQVVKNLIINCNGLVVDGIRAIRGRKVHFDNIVVINPVNNGIIINTGGWENMISNIHISRYLPSLGGTGIYVEGSDNIIDKVVVIGCQYGIINVGGDNHYSHVHPWSTTKAMENLKNCVSFGCFGSFCSFNQCMGDSTTRIFEFKYNARALITNCANTWADGYVENSNTNPYLFYFVDDEDEKNHTHRGAGVTVSSCYFKPKASEDYPDFKTYFSNLTEEETLILVDKFPDGWQNAPKSIESLFNDKLDYKLDKPTSDGTSGQVLTLADDGTTKWQTPTGGGGSGEQVDLSGYAKKEYVDNAISNIDLTGYAKESYVDEKLGDIETAFDELHNYAQSLITGGVSE